MKSQNSPNSKFSFSFLFLFSFLFSTPSSAQVDFTGGLMVGGVTSQMSGDALAGWDKFGVTGGGWIHMDFNGVMGTYLGLQYINKGSKKQADPDNGDNNVFAFRLNYIDMPLMLTYSKSNFRFGLGPSVGVLVSQKMVYNDISYEPNPNFETLDLAGIFSVTYQPEGNIGIEFRGGTSVIPIRPAPAVVNKLSYYEQGNYNQWMQIGIQYRF